ncbi:MAG: helix-turn-helix transcriptional regulator [Patescibacteria group bacterium]
MGTNKNNQNQPFQDLGAKIRSLREQWDQSIGELSGTLELDPSLLVAIESGKTLPSEDILDMIIEHFLLTDEQAEDLLKTIEEYDIKTQEALGKGLEDALTKQMVMLMPLDSKVVYTDSMQATVNQGGVVIQFSQQVNGQSVPVSRVGMSREHAEKMIDVLKDTIKSFDQNKKF